MGNVQINLGFSALFS